ncbi:hypothetical protein [Nonomuraea rhizosphaerae]|uniref:hypothetical protein n=1 Tax=Nonomuraea rhizosphaerae TaxID=2665663 RepID=UPI001C5F6CDC|nr:hypothetical protein [Nonomuraea rhizosphaerae]
MADNLLGERPELGKGMRPLPKSTVSDLINARSKKLPDWLLVRTFVYVCHEIATHSGLPIDSREDLEREFGQLWKAAKTDEGNRSAAGRRGRAATRTNMPTEHDHNRGDVLEPTPRERSSWRPLASTQPVPTHWRRLGNLRLKLAENGDARAAYELAVLLACEAAGKGDSVEDRHEATHWRFLAAYWRGKALGRIKQAAELQLQGAQLLKAAKALALEYTEAHKPTARYFETAVEQAQAALDRPAPGPQRGSVTGSPPEQPIRTSTSSPSSASASNSTIASGLGPGRMSSSTE